MDFEAGEISPSPARTSSNIRNVASGTKKPRKSRAKAPESRIRKAPENVATALSIPRSISEFCEADKVMWDMHKAGKSWTEITPEWERITGQKTAKTTLPNRLARIKDFIGDFSEVDDDLLLQSKQELEKTFSEEVWLMISEVMVNKGGNRFSAAAIKRRFEQLNEVSREHRGETELVMGGIA